MKGATNMKNLLRVAGIAIALTAIGVAVKAIYEKNKVYEIEVGGLNNIPKNIQRQFGLDEYSLKE